MPRFQDLYKMDIILNSENAHVISEINKLAGLHLRAGQLELAAELAHKALLLSERESDPTRNSWLTVAENVAVIYECIQERSSKWEEVKPSQNSQQQNVRKVDSQWKRFCAVSTITDLLAA